MEATLKLSSLCVKKQSDQEPVNAIHHRDNLGNTVQISWFPLDTALEKRVLGTRREAVGSKFVLFPLSSFMVTQSQEQF